ncbi:hypothetical protein [Haloferula sp. BvORR071]|uniref:hypothetical protein n=1 Tax=Haloferula sp. BvORR071 TaxID=1396141 RepID=UPI00054CF4B8|nr:hypothetical protein [Haloferula sp. BvORR071]
MDPALIESLQLAREDCRIGDWVEAITVPEWREEIEPQKFSSGAIDISPGSEDFGGMSPASRPETWIFEPDELNGKRIWRRTA